MQPLIARLYHQIDGWISQQTFEPIPPMNQFRRVVNNGFQIIVLSSAGTSPVEVEVFLGVRIDLVEQLAYQFTAGLSGYGPYSTTLLVPARKVIQKEIGRYTLYQEGDIEETHRQFQALMTEYGFAFLDQFSGVSALDVLYNSEPSKKQEYLTNEFHRALRGIILAKLVDRPSWLDLTEIYQAKLEKRAVPEVQLAKYQQLVSFLKNYSFN